MSDSSESDVSSSYSSDGKVITLFKKTSNSPPSSDEDSDPGSQANGSIPSFPLGTLSEEDRKDILKIFEFPAGKPDIQIFPPAVRNHMTQQHSHIVSRLSELPGSGKLVVIATRSLQTLLAGGDQEKTAPKGVLCDICVFSPTEPALVLTIMTGASRKDRLTRYNSQVTRLILQHVRDNTRYNFSAVYGVVEDTCCHTRDDFVAAIKDLKQYAQKLSLPRALVMTDTKCLEITRVFLQLLLVDEPLQAYAKLEERREVFTSVSHFDALVKRIEQLELGAKQEKEKSEEKYEKIYEELQQMKQNYLTDIRLSLLMRPRSSSVGESTTVSGYDSAEVDIDVDIASRQEAAWKDDGEKSHQTTGKHSSDVDQPMQDSKFSKEDIYTGDIELVKYNRDITLHQACEEGKLDVVKYILVNKIANINCIGIAGRTPVMLAALNGQVAVFDFLVSNGCDMSMVDDYKDNILHAACIGGNVNIVKTILVTGICGIESRGRYGRTPVMAAVRLGRKAVFEFLISKGCNLSAVDDDKDNIFHWACMGGNTNVVKKILNTGKYDIESKGKHGKTPVMKAVREGHKAVFEFLLSQGCSLSAVDDTKNNVFHLACMGGNTDIISSLLYTGKYDIEGKGCYGRTPVMKAVYFGHRGAVDYLVSQGSDLKTVDDDGDTILHVACLGGLVAVVKYILSLDVVSIESRGECGRTPLMTAAVHGKRAVFDFLVSSGSDLTAADHNDFNILHLACVGGDVDIVKHVMTRGDVDRQMKNKAGKTYVQLAESEGHAAVVSLLKAEK